jgi:hypothetical protein
LRRCAHAQFAIAKLERDEVDSNCDEDADVKSDPKPNAGCHGEEVFTSREPRQSQIGDGARRVRCVA